jgi:hypothetical protein
MKNNNKINKNTNINADIDNSTSQDTQTSGVKFMEKYIGNDKNDEKHFLNQKYLIQNNTTSYLEDLNYNSKINKNRFENDKYNEQVNSELRKSDYRINTSETVVDNINLSNPVIYPREYDEYFEYLSKKSINSIDTRVVVSNIIYNLDSNNSIKTQDKTIQNIPINDNSLQFTNGSDKLKINFDNSKYILKENDMISLSGVSNSTITINNLNFIFKNNSDEVIIDIAPNFNRTINYLPVYINFQLETTDKYFQNIPLQILNRTHKINIVKYNGISRMSITIPILFYSENVYNINYISNCVLTLFSIGNYPTNLLNTSINTETNLNSLLPFFVIENVTKKYIEIQLKGNVSINNNFTTGIEKGDSIFTGSNITLNKISFDNNNIVGGEYYFELGENVKNVASMSIDSSELPNINYNINSTNNKFYWSNLTDENSYNIEINVGNYTYPQLKTEIEDKVSKVKRNGINGKNQHEYNIIVVDFDISNETSYFTSANIFYFMKPFKKLISIQDVNNYYIEIYHPNHNLKSGDRIFIFNSLDYYVISNLYINTIEGHLIEYIINQNTYTILISNINPITDVGDTGGGNSINLKCPNSFSLNFSYTDTFGDLMGFANTGMQFSITQYSSSINKYIITNKQPYSYNVDDALLINQINSPNRFFKNNYKSYILLKVNTFNIKNQSGTKIQYFYKFQLPITENNNILNTFVNEPIIFDPPIPSLSSLNLSWVYPDGTDVNFYGKNFSMSIKLTTISNSPQNTNLNSNLGRI